MRSATPGQGQPLRLTILLPRGKDNAGRLLREQEVILPVRGEHQAAVVANVHVQQSLGRATTRGETHEGRRAG